MIVMNNIYISPVLLVGGTGQSEHTTRPSQDHAPGVEGDSSPNAEDFFSGDGNGFS